MSRCGRQIVGPCCNQLCDLPCLLDAYVSFLDYDLLILKCLLTSSGVSFSWFVEFRVFLVLSGCVFVNVVLFSN